MQNSDRSQSHGNPASPVAAAATAAAEPLADHRHYKGKLECSLLVQQLPEESFGAAAETPTVQLIGKTQRYIQGGLGCSLQLPSTHFMSEDKNGEQDQKDGQSSDDVLISRGNQQQLFVKESFQDDSDDSSEGELIIVDEDDDKSLNETSVDSVSDIETAIDIQDCKQKTFSGNRRRIGTRNEAQQKMEDGKQWLINNVVFINTVISVIPLSSVEEAYKAYCNETGKEPLATSVLARLIKSLFPKAIKCRLGSRGNQRIHYRNLKMKKGTVLLSQPSDWMSETIRKPSSTYGMTGSTSKSTKRDCVDIINEKNLNISEQQEVHYNNSIEEEGGKALEEQDNSVESADKPQLKVNEFVKQEEKVSTSKMPIQKNPTSQMSSDEEEDCETAAKNPTSQMSSDEEEGCETAAKRLSQVLKWISNQGRKDVLLREFAHSASCQKVSCTPMCLMFRRVRRHVVAARHSCSVLILYSSLLRMHVSSCVNADCGLPACPALRATRSAKRSLGQKENPSKRTAVYTTKYKVEPSTISLAPQSPPTSLPGSPVNSPPASPDPLSYGGESCWSTQPGQVQYVIVPVLPVMVPFSNNRGA
nr:uncharacterized protein LOC123772978 isoform X1 [Procambarus clarkii]